GLSAPRLRFGEGVGGEGFNAPSRGLVLLVQDVRIVLVFVLKLAFRRGQVCNVAAGGPQTLLNHRAGNLLDERLQALQHFLRIKERDTRRGGTLDTRGRTLSHIDLLVQVTFRISAAARRLLTRPFNPASATSLEY